MLRSIAIVFALLLTLAACTSDSESTTTGLVGGSTMAGSSTGSATDGAANEPTTSPSVTRVPPADAECTTLWPETAIQEAAGEGFTFFASTSDGTGCTYSDGSLSVAVFFRDGDQTDFDTTKDGVAATSDVIELDLCDGAYSSTLAPTLGFVEALDSGSNRIFNATVNGVEDPTAIAADLIAAAC